MKNYSPNYRENITNTSIFETPPIGFLWSSALGVHLSCQLSIQVGNTDLNLYYCKNMKMTKYENFEHVFQIFQRNKSEIMMIIINETSNLFHRDEIR